MINSTDFNTGNLFASITPEIREEISAERLREQIMARHNSWEMHKFVRNVPIAYDQFKEAMEFADHLLLRSKEGGERPGGVWLLGDGGCGKSFLLEQIMKKYAPQETIHARICPILRVSFSAQPTQRDFLRTLLKQLGQNMALLNDRSIADLQKILLAALVAAKTIAIICDEAQHLWLNVLATRVADRIGGKVGDLIKDIYNSSNVAFIFSGTPGLQQILDIDSQVRTRWKGVFLLRCFSNGPEFEDVLSAIDDAIPLPERSNLERYASKIHLITEGNIRDVKDFIAQAVWFAAEAKSPSAEGHLYQACQKTFGQSRPNPFEPSHG